ncbi:MAG: hypothetical protein A2177_15315 [Spirochaetes bacterium RBG_13_68_11]|nr:MAG: hypothetical protein A2177_15315 [Spirochaetes bacterium RBG_13_68_11]
MSVVKFEVVPVGVFTTAYDVLADGLPKGRIEHRILSMRDEALISTPERTFTARREKAFRAGAVLESPEGVLRASAEKEEFWREIYRVRFEGSTLSLRQKLMSARGLFLISDESGEIGSIRLERLFSRRMVVEFTADAPPPLEITEFLVWIVLMVQRRQASP